VKLVRPKPICRAVFCEVDEVSLDEFEEVEDGIYAQPYEFAHASPSLIGDYLFCPRFLWIENKLKLKLTTKRGAIAAAVGRVIHERYERHLSMFENVITEYKIELGEVVGVADAVFKNASGVYVIEIKSNAPREAHRLQAQAYAEMLKTRGAYLVYRDRVEYVERSKEVLKIMGRIKNVLRSDTPPPPGRSCSSCPFFKICREL